MGLYLFRRDNTEEYKCCEVCGRSNSEAHHIVFRSEAPWMKNISINKIYLCNEHHRGDESPHKSKKVDLQYKRELQAKLKKMFNQQYYTTKDIKNILQTTETETEKIVKTLQRYKEGYKREDIIRRCMGGRIYD